ncbi:MAG: hypothetical protein DWI24_10285 [Planctomycetota bacterium]|nr:MAG: hypothetical protein DWI24_10285 [Planctomycetota bacterium]
MADFVINDLKDALSRHSTAALKDLAGTLGSYVPEGANAHEDWVSRISQVWADPSSAMHLAKGFSASARDALGILAWGHWDRPIGLTELASILQIWGHSPAESIGPLIAFGAIVPFYADSVTVLPLALRKQIVETGLREGVNVAIWPSLVDRIEPPSAPPVPMSELILIKEVQTVQAADPAELVARLLSLWQHTTIDPIRRTLNSLIHKKDRDRLLREPIFAIPPTAFPVQNPNWLDFAIDTLVDWSWRVGLLVSEKDQFSAASGEWWDEHSFHLPQLLARSSMAITFDSATLDTGTTSVKQAADLAAWLNVILLVELASLEPDIWVDLNSLIQSNLTTLLQAPPQGGGGRPSKNRAKPTDLALSDLAPVIESWVAGPAWLGGLVQFAQPTDAESLCVQITPLGRFMMGHGDPPRAMPSIEKSLFLQPNLEGIFYRQGLTAANLAKIVRLLKFTAIGPVLQGRLDETWMRQMFASSHKVENLLDDLSDLSAIPVATSVLETIRTWAGKSDRIRVYRSAVLLEAVDPADRPGLIARFGPDDLTEPVGSTWLIVADEERIPFKGLRIVAQQDQTRDPIPCVRSIGDGTSLEVDSTKSDLALDPQLNRFATPSEPGSDFNQNSSPGTYRFFRIDTNSLQIALEKGVTSEWINSFFVKRTGKPTPASVYLLWKCVEASKPIEETARHSPAPNPTPTPTRTLKSIGLERVVVLTCDDEQLIDGLLNLDSTSRFFDRRFGPHSVKVNESEIPDLLNQLSHLGLRISHDLKIQSN